MTFFIQLLHSRAGAVIQWLVGLLVGWLTAQAVALGIDIPAESWQLLQTALTGLGAFVITFVVQWYQARQNIRIQTAANVTKDAWIGEKTVAAIEDLAAAIRK